MTSFETGVWQATYGAAMATDRAQHADGLGHVRAATRANTAVLNLRLGAEEHWMPVLEGHIPLPDAGDTCPD